MKELKDWKVFTLIVILSISCSAQNSNFLIQELRSESCERINSLAFKEINSKRDTTLLDYVLNNLLTDDITVHHLKNRFKLRVLKVHIRDDFEYSAFNELSEYDTSNIKVHLTRHRKQNIQKFVVKWNGNELQVPEEDLKEIEHANFNEIYYFNNPVESYLSLDNQFLYIYLFSEPTIIRKGEDIIGGKISWYFVKYIFSKEKYIGRIFIPYPILKSYSLSCNELIGF